MSSEEYYDSVAKYAKLFSTKKREPIAVNRASATTDAIEKYILDKKLSPGDPLPTEAILCADLGVSRSSVREALRQLQALDIVTVQQGRGTFVGNMSIQPLVKTLILRSSIGTDPLMSLREVIQVRQTLDLGLAGVLVAKLEGTEQKELHEVVDKMLIKAEKHKRFLEEDIAFHTGLVNAIGNTLVEQLTGAMWLIHMTALPEISQQSDGLLQTAHAHRAMLVAAQEGNIDAYENAVHKHYEPLIRLLPELK